MVFGELPLSMHSLVGAVRIILFANKDYLLSKYLKGVTKSTIFLEIIENALPLSSF